MCQENYRRKKSFYLWISIAVVGGFIAFTWLISWLWNALLPELFGLPVISFWQAAGLFILSRILFGRSPSSNPWKRRHRHHLRERYMAMSPEEKAQFRTQWKQRCEMRQSGEE